MSWWNIQELRNRGWLMCWVLFRKFGVQCVCARSGVWLCDPMGCSPPGPSVHGSLQARTLEWVAILSSRGSSRPRDWTCVACIFCTAGGFFTTEPPGKPCFYVIPKYAGTSFRSLWCSEKNANHTGFIFFVFWQKWTWICRAAISNPQFHESKNLCEICYRIPSRD